MKTLRIKTHLQKHKEARQSIFTDDKYITNGEFLFACSEVNLPSIQASFRPNISEVAHNLLRKKLTPVQPVINKANCYILDVHSFISPVYTYMLKPFLKDSQYHFYTTKIANHVTGVIELDVSILFIYRGTEFVGLFYPSVCLDTGICRTCNEM